MAEPSERAKKWKELNDIVMRERAVRGDLDWTPAEHEALREREAAQPDLITEDRSARNAMELGARVAVEFGANNASLDGSETWEQLKITSQEIKRRAEAQQAAKEARREADLDKVFGDLGGEKQRKG